LPQFLSNNSVKIWSSILKRFTVRILFQQITLQSGSGPIQVQTNAHLCNIHTMTLIVSLCFMLNIVPNVVLV